MSTRLHELTSKLEAAIREAARARTRYEEAVDRLADARRSLLLQGVEGRNAEEREARLALLTREYELEVREARAAWRAAEAELEAARVAWRTELAAVRGSSLEVEEVQDE